jgi:Flp pilus assembly protein TadD
MVYDRPFFLPGQDEEAEAKEAARAVEPGKAGLRGSVVVMAAAVTAAVGAWIWLDNDSRAAHSAQAEARRIAQSSDAYVVTDEPSPRPRQASEKSSPTGERVASESSAEAALAAETPSAGQPPEVQRQAQVVEAMEQGRLYTTIGRHDVAAAHYAEAAQLDPSNASVRYKLALAYVRSGQTASARREMAKLEQLDPSLASLLGNLLR